VEKRPVVFVAVCVNVLCQARLQRANVKLKQGKLDEARVDYEEVVSTFLWLICSIAVAV